MATVDGIARGHGGALALRSPPGRGAAFRLYLPCADPGSEELPLEPLPDAPLPRLSGRALLLDDDPFVRAVLRALLRTCGAELAIADRAPEALGLLARGDFALVLLDPALPERAGPALFAELRRRAPELPVVLLCGHGEEPARRTWPGCVAYVRKPFRLRDLLSALAPLLGDRSPPTDSAAAP
ncbi:MAG: hybrid sensor histidine kinase/response regulator [Planctomycetota bacterium]|nr:MAG: hybrid sensor histidine kinase/response regulator [Planctomycetota bacterium]